MLGLREGGSTTGADQPGNELDVEHPPGEKGLAKQLAQFGRPSEELRAALGIVDLEPEQVGHRRGEDAPQVVPCLAPANGPPEQLHARAEDHLDVWARVEKVAEISDGLERGRQVRVPVAHVLRTEFESLEDPCADG